MEVFVKYSVREMVGDLRDGFYQLPEGSVISDLIEASSREADIMLNEETKRSIIFLVNNRPAFWDTALKQGDSIRVLYKIIGG
jgi:molybdopterin converting factor small subunit